MKTTASLSFEGGWVGHLAPKAFLQSDLLRCASRGIGREEGGRLGGWGRSVGGAGLALFVVGVDVDTRDARLSRRAAVGATARHDVVVACSCVV
jgi:hypothetical protein